MSDTELVFVLVIPNADFISFLETFSLLWIMLAVFYALFILKAFHKVWYQALLVGLLSMVFLLLLSTTSFFYRPDSKSESHTTLLTSKELKLENNGLFSSLPPYSYMSMAFSQSLRIMQSLVRITSIFTMVSLILPIRSPRILLPAV